MVMGQHMSKGQKGTKGCTGHKGYLCVTGVIYRAEGISVGQGVSREHRGISMGQRGDLWGIRWKERGIYGTVGMYGVRRLSMGQQGYLWYKGYL